MRYMDFLNLRSAAPVRGGRGQDGDEGALWCQREWECRSVVGVLSSALLKFIKCSGLFSVVEGYNIEGYNIEGSTQTKAVGRPGRRNLQ